MAFKETARESHFLISCGFFTFNLALWAVWKNLQQPQEVSVWCSAAFRKTPVLRDTPEFTKHRAEPSSLSQLDTPTLKKKERIFAHPEQSQRSQLCVRLPRIHMNVQTQTQLWRYARSLTLNAHFKTFGTSMFSTSQKWLTGRPIFALKVEYWNKPNIGVL